MIEKLCKNCHKRFKVYNTIQNLCYDCELEKRKKKTLSNPSEKRKTQSRTSKNELYEKWRDLVARPYLDKRYGRHCKKCGKMPPKNMTTGEYGYHDVDHIIKRSVAPGRVRDVKNVQYLCRDCHRKKDCGGL